jgi:hypothetical protein
MTNTNIRMAPEANIAAPDESDNLAAAALPRPGKKKVFLQRPHRQMHAQAAVAKHVGLHRLSSGTGSHSGHKLRIRAQDAGAPAAVVRKQGLPKSAGLAKRLRPLAQAVAVGRIDDEKSWGTWDFTLTEVGHRKVNIGPNLRARGVAAGNLHRVGVAIPCDDRGKRG